MCVSALRRRAVVLAICLPAMPSSSAFAWLGESTICCRRCVQVEVYIGDCDHDRGCCWA
jgi:hypothetical protein